MVFLSCPSAVLRWTGFPGAAPWRGSWSWRCRAVPRPSRRRRSAGASPGLPGVSEQGLLRVQLRRHRAGAWPPVPRDVRRVRDRVGTWPSERPRPVISISPGQLSKGPWPGQPFPGTNPHPLGDAQASLLRPTPDISVCQGISQKPPTAWRGLHASGYFQRSLRVTGLCLWTAAPGGPAPPEVGRRHPAAPSPQQSCTGPVPALLSLNAPLPPGSEQLSRTHVVERHHASRHDPDIRPSDLLGQPGAHGLLESQKDPADSGLGI